MKRIFLYVFAIATVLTGCHHASVPEHYTDVNKAPDIYPDYRDVTIPVNIAPLTFEMNDSTCEEVVARFTLASTPHDASVRSGFPAAAITPHDASVRSGFPAAAITLVCGGDKVQPDIADWRQLTAAAKGEAILVDVFTRSGNQWQHYNPFKIYVSPDSIDPYISYRLISPSYVAYEELTLNQRCLENYDETVMVDNMLCSTEDKGQCVNCHNYQQYNPKRMQFHARQNHGGTVICYDGTVRKINMRNDSIISAGVYPAWHPWLPLIVYSTNHTGQSFHTHNNNKIEVFDSASDLIAYDVENNEVTNIENDTTEFEVYPCWAPDGRSIYYCSAHFEFRDTVSKEMEVILRAKEIKYNIYRKSFDPDTYTFGPRELVFAADSLDKSATLPRISPDGRFLMFTLGNYGVFHIWHHEADLWMMDLSRDLVPRTSYLAPRKIEEINSDDTESYHSWSSNGRWVVFSSRRNDGGFTRPFIAHIDADGKGSKAFELPQADPDYHRQFMKSYNIPEFMRGPVEVTPQTFASTLKGSDGEPVKYVRRLRIED